MLRSALLFLSRRRWLRRWMEQSRFSRRLVRRFVAGETLESAIAVCRRLRDESIDASLDHLGENVASPEAAAGSLEAALAALRALGEAALPATISLKPTQFGLDISGDLCRDLVARLAEAARDAGRRLEIDMESSEYTARTLDLVHFLHTRYANIRAVIQAYLRRSEEDIARLSRDGIPVRLCKGAYLEPAGIAFPTKPEVDASYRRLMLALLEQGVHPALATHDEKLIREALAFLESRGLGPDHMEFQMLYGVRRDLQRELVARGWRLRLYVPYGVAWYPYFMRRLAERPANVLFLLRALVKR